MSTINPTITDQMIEQGRKALTFGIMGCGCCGENPPDELDHLDFDVARAHVAARATLEAAAPLIAAQALREAAETYTVTIPDALGYKVQAVFTEDLMARADLIEQGGQP